MSEEKSRPECFGKMGTQNQIPCEKMSNPEDCQDYEDCLDEFNTFIHQLVNNPICIERVLCGQCDTSMMVEIEDDEGIRYRCIGCQHEIVIEKRTALHAWEDGT